MGTWGKSFPERLEVSGGDRLLSLNRKSTRLPHVGMYGASGRSSENAAKTPPRKGEESAIITPIKDGEVQPARYINVGGEEFRAA